MKKYFGIFSIFLCLNIQNTLSIDESIFIQQFFKPGDLVFDVGTNIGKKTDLYLKNSAKVVCIEPQSACINILNHKYANNSNVIAIIPKGLAAEQGSLELSICSSANTISTFSKEWQMPGGRFHDSGYKWNKKEIVEVTTLDEVINQYGLPQFCKIDVENFEYEVLKGLSIPIPYISFEYAAETFHNTEKCINHLVSLGYKKFNFSLAEKPRLKMPQWISAKQIKQIITEKINRQKDLWGDIYAKYE